MLQLPTAAAPLLLRGTCMCLLLEAARAVTLDASVLLEVAGVVLQGV